MISLNPSWECTGHTLGLALLVTAGWPRCAPSCPGTRRAELAQPQGFNEHFRLPATRHEAIDTATTRLELCSEQILLHL